VKQAFARMAMRCAEAQEAEPLFQQVLARLQVARDSIQKLYDDTDDKEQQQLCLKVFGDVMTKLSFAGSCTRCTAA
jgi:hypothetical protein